jgi:hypothetical protein
MVEWGHMKSYLLGYCVGYVLDNVSGCNEFLVERKKDWEVSPGRWIADTEVVVHKTREKAEKAARRLMKGSDARWFVRGYEYCTGNPKNAKGLKLMEEVEDTGVIWLS